jgi:hypothetical protein
VALVGEGTVPTERLPLVGEVSANFSDRQCRVISATDPHSHILGFLEPGTSWIVKVIRKIATTVTNLPINENYLMMAA